MLNTKIIRFYSVLPKNPKLELTMRTPTRTLFKAFSGFTRLYVTGPDNGTIGIGTGCYPRAYLLPSGHISIKNLTKGPGNYLKSESGDLVHSGGWLVSHDNNVIHIYLTECIEKELFKYEKLLNSPTEIEQSIAAPYERRLQDLSIKGMARKI